MHKTKIIASFIMGLFPLMAHTEAIDPNFPYGQAPQPKICATTDNYATPETLLGSWAMIMAVENDSCAKILPSFMTPDNTVYAVGTAALGNQLGINDCASGCDQLNGYCFAIKFNDKTSYPYMIFQSINIGANNDSFDVYVAGGGCGAFCNMCQKFWGTDSSVNWEKHIEDSNCEDYFGNFSSVNPTYSTTYNGKTYSAKDTLIQACKYAAKDKTGFSTANFRHLSVVPVSCPQTLIQITGLGVKSTVSTIGNKKIIPLNQLTEKDFGKDGPYNLDPNSNIIETTQMQDCKTPSSGYCNKDTSYLQSAYQVSISADLNKPLVTPPLDNSYCIKYPNIKGYCSWYNGTHSDAPNPDCDASQSVCFGCGNSSMWCTCDDKRNVTCTSK